MTTQKKLATLRQEYNRVHHQCNEADIFAHANEKLFDLANNLPALIDEAKKILSNQSPKSPAADLRKLSEMGELEIGMWKLDVLKNLIELKDDLRRDVIGAQERAGGGLTSQEWDILRKERKSRAEKRRAKKLQKRLDYANHKSRKEKEALRKSEEKLDAKIQELTKKFVKLKGYQALHQACKQHDLYVHTKFCNKYEISPEFSIKVDLSGDRTKTYADSPLKPGERIAPSNMAVPGR